MRWALALSALLTLSLLCASLLALTASSFWLGGLAVHFPLQYAALALITFVIFQIGRRPGWAALALLVAVFNVMNAAPALAKRPQALPIVTRGAGDPVPLRIAALNVLYTNRQFQRVADFIHRERPDAIVLVEMSDAWRAALTGVEREFPHRYATRGREGRGVVLWSRVPMEDMAVLPLGGEAEPAIQATLVVHSHRVRLFGVHMSWPMTPAAAALRNRQLENLARHAKAHGSLPLVVAGDLNVSPFAPQFGELLRDGGLRSAANGFGWQPTWPAFLPPAGIQIDHALVNTAVAVRSFRRGPAVGSDHRPIVVDLLL